MQLSSRHPAAALQTAICHGELSPELWREHSLMTSIFPAQGDEILGDGSSRRRFLNPSIRWKSDEIKGTALFLSLVSDKTKWFQSIAQGSRPSIRYHAIQYAARSSSKLFLLPRQRTARAIAAKTSATQTSHANILNLKAE